MKHYYEDDERYEKDFYDEEYSSEDEYDEFNEDGFYIEEGDSDDYLLEDNSDTNEELPSPSERPKENISSEEDADLTKDLSQEDEFTEEELEAEMRKGQESLSKGNYPFLSEEEAEFYMSSNENAIKLLKTCEHLTPEQKTWLMDDFVSRNMNLVYYIANKKIQSKFMVDVKELISAGMLGFSKAISKYDPDQGAKFATFAYRCIDNEIKYGIRLESKHYSNTESSNKPKYFDKDGKALSLEETIADPNKTPEEVSSQSAKDNLIREKLNALSPLEKYIVYARFGLDNGIEMTQKQVAAAVQMSQANISKIEKNCLDKLKDIMKSVNS